MPDSNDGSAHLDGLAQDAPDAPREQTRAAASPAWTDREFHAYLIGVVAGVLLCALVIGTLYAVVRY